MIKLDFVITSLYRLCTGFKLKMQCWRSWLTLFTIITLSQQAVQLTEALKAFQNVIPNGDYTGAFQSSSFGHFKPSTTKGITGLNQFAVDFRDNGFAWTEEFCNADSDDDGFSNGVELGDPDCEFATGIDDLEIGELVSNPADPDSTPDSATRAELDALKGKSYDQTVIYVHAGLQILAWGILIPIGVAIAWTQKVHLDSNWLFHHRTIMLLAMFLSLCSVVMLMIIGPGIGAVSQSLHAILGIGVLFAGLLNMFSGLIRPKYNISANDEKSKSRCFFEAIHIALGRTATVIGIPTLLTGIQIGFPEINDNFIVLAFTVTIFFMALLLLAGITAWLNKRKVNKLHRAHDALVGEENVGHGSAFYEHAHKPNRKKAKKEIKKMHKRLEAEEEEREKEEEALLHKGSGSKRRDPPSRGEEEDNESEEREYYSDYQEEMEEEGFKPNMLKRMSGETVSISGHI